MYLFIVTSVSVINYKKAVIITTYRKCRMAAKDQAVVQMKGYRYINM